ncbi:hypothetical protein ACIBO2_09450 [Nonomuraea sp. NPDC050022]|uniref:hypothetical protein n=1 Tax=Nonomuraea sp. NPDC050022 TaxID=3364358 RepID=UPI00378FD818
MSDGWHTSLGDLLTRDERMALYGGAKYGGIEPSSTTQNVFVYSDPSRGEAFGYNFDGWNDDRTVFLYTGDGRVGDQQMRGGNRSLAEHRAEGRVVRLFIADGVVSGTGTKTHRYIGPFELDQECPHFTEEAPDKDGEMRLVYVFRLIPIGESLYRDLDKSEYGDVATATQAALVPLEVNSTPTFRNPGAAPRVASRRESDLCARYVASVGRPFQRWRIVPVGESRPLFTDLYDEEANELYEAKGVTTRDAVRQAVGQLLDYRRHIEPTPRMALLLPHRPSADLIEYLHAVEVSCVYEAPSSGFVRIAAISRPELVPISNED